MTPEMLLACKETGIAVFLALGIFILLAWLVRILATKITANMDLLNKNMQEHNTVAIQRGKYIREEHGRMIGSLKEIQEALGRINGYNKE